MEVWYPSHVEKAKRAIKSLIKLVSGIVEVVDARAPMATRPLDMEPYFKDKKRMIFLNKADLAEDDVTKRNGDENGKLGEENESAARPIFSACPFSRNAALRGHEERK